MQFSEVTLLVFLVHAVAVAVSLYDYCKFKCFDPKEIQTVCKTKCKQLPNNTLVTPKFEFRKGMVDLHNELRQNIACGNDSRGGNQKASNMMAVSYDMELEFVISCWLMANDYIKHDKCRGVARWPQAGQNLYLHTLLAKLRPADGPTMINMGIMSYYNEIKLLPASELTSFTGETGQKIGHFTQLVWHSNAFIGCATVLVDIGKKSPRLLQGCNYGIGGNWVGLKVYEFGEPASKCPKGLGKNSKYPALCGEIKPYEPEAYKPGNPMLAELLKMYEPKKSESEKSESEKSESKKKGPKKGGSKKNESKQNGCPGSKTPTLNLGGVLFVVSFLTLS